jgi:multidrug transporter EmrE-like cation transporter
MLLFDESRAAPRLLFIAVVLIGMVGLKVTAAPAGPP